MGPSVIRLSKVGSAVAKWILDLSPTEERPEVEGCGLIKKLHILFTILSKCCIKDEMKNTPTYWKSLLKFVFLTSSKNLFIFSRKSIYQIFIVETPEDIDDINKLLREQFCKPELKSSHCIFETNLLLSVMKHWAGAYAAAKYFLCIFCVPLWQKIM